ncbi:MAG TPA: hypothetical protein DEP36_01825, partial [Gammaproteobacteria bacterium]|nr:hypothetical protein [Gammaproteobacteria bacterium]
MIHRFPWFARLLFQNGGRSPLQRLRMFSREMRIAGYDDALWAALQGEKQRQEDHIELIAS